MAFPSLPTRQMQCAFISLVWIGLSCIAVEINADGDFGELFGRLGNKQREFDYFKLSLQWPGTACLATRHCCSSNACCRRLLDNEQYNCHAMICKVLRDDDFLCSVRQILVPTITRSRGSDALTDFTIHGLWPDYNDGTWPACCSGKIFDVKEISTLLSGLNTYWPSLSCDAPSNCHGGKGLFWEHEWEKHGTCSSPVVRDEYDYFVTTLNLYFKYNVTKVLKEAGYIASNSEKYPLQGIVSAIQNAYHATPEFECLGDAVEELRLCFSKDFKLRNCTVDSNAETGMNNSEESCPGYVSLPEVVSLKLENSGSFTI